MATSSSPAVVAAIVSGIISIIGAIISNIHQSRQQKKRDKIQEIENWYDDVIEIAISLKLSTIDIETNGELSFQGPNIDWENSKPEINKIGVRLNELRKLNTNPPQSIEGGGVARRVNKLTNRLMNPKGGKNTINSRVDLKEFVYEESHRIEQMVDSEKEETLREYRSIFHYFF